MSEEKSTSPLNASLTLPCGIVLKNRVVKSAMSDSLGDGEGNPSKAQLRLYERWAEGGVALSLIGEVQVTPDHPEKPGNLVLGDGQDDDRLAELAQRASIQGAQIWPQLGHAGALSHPPVSIPKGPSKLDLEGLSCQAMTAQEIQALPTLYARAAKHAKTAGFGGVQIHAGHGFLLSQFLSPLFNHRDDEFGGSIENRFRIIHLIINAARDAVGPNFAIGIRINSSDLLEGGLTEADALTAIKILDATSVDLIDISGGTYFPGAPSSSDRISTGGAYYTEFARRAKAITSIPIMLTGGIKTKSQAEAVIASGAADLVGIARAMALDVNLPNNWINGDQQDPKFPQFQTPPAGGITAWYSMRLTAIGNDIDHEFDASLDDALRQYDQRDDERSALWRKHFC